jgi:hypothetical protein
VALAAAGGAALPIRYSPFESAVELSQFTQFCHCHGHRQRPQEFLFCQRFKIF